MGGRGDKGGGKARPIAFEDMLTKMVTGSILRAHISQVRRAAGAYHFGIDHRGGAPEKAWKIHAKMAAKPSKVFMACDIKNGHSLCQLVSRQTRSATKGMDEHSQGLQTNCGQTWTPAGCVRGSGGVCGLRVAVKEFDEEMRKQGVGWTTELEYWAYVDDITIATTAELAPLVMTKLRETLERHGLELKKDKCTAYCPTPERVADIQEEMTQFLKWTLEGHMILETASDGEYRAGGNGQQTSERAYVG